MHNYMTKPATWNENTKIYIYIYIYKEKKKEKRKKEGEVGGIFAVQDLTYPMKSWWSTAIATSPCPSGIGFEWFRIPASASPASELVGWSSNDCRQVGHDECDANHGSMHLRWKPWLHFGSTLTFSPSSNSPRQMGQSVAGIFRTDGDPYTATGIRRNALFLRPVAARRVAASSGVSKANLRLHLRAQRTIEFSPSAPINAQSKAARIITMLVSKFASLA